MTSPWTTVELSTRLTSSSARSRRGTTPSRLTRALEASGRPFRLAAKKAASTAEDRLSIKDAIGRKWRCATINSTTRSAALRPEKIGADNAQHQPIVIHRAIFGSFERFVALLLEHHAGAFPLWLAPCRSSCAADRRPAPRLRGVGRVHARRRRPARGAGPAAEKIGHKIRRRSSRKPMLASSATAKRPRAPSRSGPDRRRSGRPGTGRVRELRLTSPPEAAVVGLQVPGVGSRFQIADFSSASQGSYRIRSRPTA